MAGDDVPLAFGALFFAAMSHLLVWYLLDCLYADRKDRSVLFWKSLPHHPIRHGVLQAVRRPRRHSRWSISWPRMSATLLMAFVISVRAHSGVRATPCGSRSCGCSCKFCGCM